MAYLSLGPWRPWDPRFSLQAWLTLRAQTAFLAMVTLYSLDASSAFLALRSCWSRGPLCPRKAGGTRKSSVSHRTRLTRRAGRTKGTGHSRWTGGTSLARRTPYSSVSLSPCFTRRSRQTWHPHLSLFPWNARQTDLPGRTKRTLQTRRSWFSIHPWLPRLSLYALLPSFPLRPWRSKTARIALLPISASNTLRTGGTGRASPALLSLGSGGPWGAPVSIGPRDSRGSGGASVPLHTQWTLHTRGAGQARGTRGSRGAGGALGARWSCWSLFALIPALALGAGRAGHSLEPVDSCWTHQPPLPLGALRSW